MELDEQYRKRREKNFAVKVVPCRDAVLPGELKVEFTHNGYQWAVITLMPDEARKFIAALREALNDTQ